MNAKLQKRHASAILFVVAGILMPSCACLLARETYIRVICVTLFFLSAMAVALMWSLLSFALRVRALYSAVVFFLLSLAVSSTIGFFLYMNETPIGRFEVLLMSPVPQSVKMIEYSNGVRHLKHRQEACAFTISPTDFAFLASNCSFSVVNPASIESCDPRWYVLGFAYKYTNQFRINPSLFYYKEWKPTFDPNGDPQELWFLMANEATNRAMVYYEYEN